MTAAVEGGEWSATRPGRTLHPGKTRYPFYRMLGGPQGRSGRAENLVPTGIRSRTVQPVVSHYTDWATRPTKHYDSPSYYGASDSNITYPNEWNTPLIDNDCLSSRDITERVISISFNHPTHMFSHCLSLYISFDCFRSSKYLTRVCSIFTLTQTSFYIEEWKTSLMSLAILFHFFCAQHVSGINISIIRSLRLCWWITTSVVLFSVRCVLELWCDWF